MGPRCVILDIGGVPDPRAYGIACERLGVGPGDCLFVDDYLPCVEGARAAGMRAHLFEDNERTLARIAEHLAGGADR